MLKNRRQLVFTAALGLLLAACPATRMYVGPERSRDEVGRIEGMNPLNPLNGGVSARILSVDGQPVPSKGYELDLLPGTYRLVCSVDGAELTTELAVEAGHSYILAKVFSGGGDPGVILDTTRK